uniref:ShKT domain-containing protein n=1 Tax=Panagrolaimus sp. PS1159 TaxID=55785 RepID=A0AC35FKF3_9BILA
ICCQLWGVQGQCSSNATWMACNCRVACGYCIPQEYDYGTCENYHRDCVAWARLGECQKNPWMLENCKASCRTCFGNAELRSRCGAAAFGGRRRGRDLGEYNDALFEQQEGYGAPGGQESM